MTPDFKQTLLQYLVGKLDIGTENNVPSFSSAQYYDNTLVSKINTAIAEVSGTNGSILGYVQGLDADGDGISNIAVYGNFTNSNSVDQGFLAVVDYELNLLDLITTYKGGTELPYLCILNVDEEGKFFGVSTDSDGISNPKLLLLSNFLIKLETAEHYTVSYRQSYSLEYYLFPYVGVKKDPNGSNYLIVGTGVSIPHATTIKINVGSENEIVEYSIDLGSQSYEASDCIASWDTDGNIDFTISGFTKTPGHDEDYHYTYGEITGSTEGGTTMILTEYGNTFYGDTDYIASLTTALSSTSGYFAVELVPDKSPESSNYKTIYVKNEYGVFMVVQLISTPNSSNEGIKLEVKDDQVFYATFAEIDGVTKLYAGFENKTYGQDFIEALPITAVPPLNTLIVLNMYNLYKFLMQTDEGCYTASIIYNSNNYNGEKYIDINGLVPNNVIIYDANSRPIFARNLYNMTVNGNTTVSTVEIPNLLLNDTTLNYESLHGETNIELISEVQEITKNIYETLYINFYNSLIMRNDNDENNKITNLIGATRINQSVSSLNDYTNAQATYYRINYSDGTTADYEINSNVQISISGDELTTATYTITVYVPTDKIISSVQILSHDKTTTYVEIDTSSLESGKYYNITQNVDIL